MSTAQSLPPNAMPNAILHDGDKPLWNLTETTAYPVDLNKTPVYLYLTPYATGELKDILKTIQAGYRRDKRDVEIVRDDRDVYSPLLDNHFVQLGNATGTPEQQRAFLNRYSELKSGMIALSYGGLTRENKKDDTGDVAEIFDISTDLSGKVDVFQLLYDPAADASVRVDMVHKHAHPTESQYRQFRGARRNKFLGKKTLWTVTENHDMLEDLYDQVITSIDGAAVNGKPCTSETKALWVGSVPLWHKLFIVDQIFGEVVEKNA